jgi:hypothetical protein
MKLFLNYKGTKNTKTRKVLILLRAASGSLCLCGRLCAYVCERASDSMA